MTNKKNKRGRNVSGVLLLDKPAGWTSNDILQKVKRLFDANKAGHTGSLDKPATGMLPICFGEATKFTSYLLNADKHYYAQCQLGIETTTGDADGEITVTSKVPNLSQKDILAAIVDFQGEILQIPPMYSAIKQNGQRLYKLAYQGLTVSREPRPVTIYGITLASFKDNQLEIEVYCSKGTYVRTLVEDIGRRIGCGAHIIRLHRTGVNHFSSEQMISFDKLVEISKIDRSLLDKVLFPVDSFIKEMPEIILVDSVSHYLRDGQAVIVPNAPTSGMLRIYNENHDFLGVGEVLDDGRIAPRRLVNI